MPHSQTIVPGHVRKRSLGWLAVAWMEHFCVHGPGDIVGTPLDRNKGGIPLSLELTAYTVDCYALGEDGRRLYDECWLIRPKGCDKSGHAGRIALFEGMGPCRFAGWAKGGEVFKQGDFTYVYSKGEPMGKGVATPFIRIMATEESQTGNVYDVIYHNLTFGPLRQFFRYGDDIGLTRVNLPNGGEIRPSTASAASKDGGRETHVVADEPHLYTTPDTKGMYDTVTRNMVKLKEAEPWLNGVSTMYAPGQQSVLEAAHNYVKDIEAGKIESWTTLWDYRCAPPGCDTTSSTDVLMAGLKEAYGDAFSYMDVPRLIRNMRDPRKDPADQRRFFLNQLHSGSSMAFDSVAWDKSATDEEIPKGRLVTLGFDGSRTSDATALIATDVETGKQQQVAIWERGDEDFKTYLEDAPVDIAVRGAFERWEVWRMYGDKAKWETMMAVWAGRYGHDRVIALPATMSARMAWIIKAYATAIRAGEVLHVRNKRFDAHIGNSHKFTLRVKDEDNLPLYIIQKDGLDSPRKIDAAWAGAASWQARLDAVAAGAKAPGGWVVV